MKLSLAQQRKLLFTPCRSRAHFKGWIKQFLDMELPDCTVVEESTSNPLDAAWTYYDRMLRNDLVGFSQVMTYAGRGGFKTLSAAILETMVLLHTSRNVGHMAAVDAQSQKSASYVKGFFLKPGLRDFVVGDNARGVRIVRYTHKTTGEILTDAEFGQLDIGTQAFYDRSDNYLKIVICTLAGSQSEHVEFFVIDEIDVVPKQNVRAYRLAKNIPDPRAGMLPFTLLTSTRKSRIGLVQKEIDAAKDSGLQVQHWNLMDVTEACQPDRHKPDLPRETYFVNDDTVKHITAREHATMNPGQQKKWRPIEGFAGCKTCRLFPGCAGRLATHQKSTSPMLKPITFSIAKFQEAATPEDIITEYLCRKPDASGLVYARLNPLIHCKTAQEMGEMVTGMAQGGSFNKADLITLLKTKGASFFAGMDFGFTHNFACVTIAQFGQYVFVLDCYSQPGLELEDQVINCEFLKKVYNNPPVWADPAYPGSVTTFHRKGYRTKNWDKTAGSVKAGIEIVRSLLWNGKGVTRLFFIKDDPGVELLVKNLGLYSYQMDAAGEPTEEPVKSDDDEADALRYVAMNALGSKDAIKDNTQTAIKTEAQKAAAPPAPTKPAAQQEWMKEYIRAATGGSEVSTTAPGGGNRVRKGRFIWEQ